MTALIILLAFDALQQAVENPAETGMVVLAAFTLGAAALSEFGQ
jgi:hypothetical protein